MIAEALNANPMKSNISWYNYTSILIDKEREKIREEKKQFLEFFKACWEAGDFKPKFKRARNG